MIGHVIPESSRTRKALDWPGLAGLPLEGLNSAVASVLCNDARGSLPLDHDEWRGSSSITGTGTGVT